LRIGALVRTANLAATPRVRRDYGVLSRALLSGASGQLRNKATTAGNLLQTNALLLFSTTRPNPATSAIPDPDVRRWRVFNRIHAILGASSDCNRGTHPSDMA